MPFDHAAIEERLEQSADAVAEQYAADVAQRGVGPWYTRTQPGTAYEPAQSE